MVNQEKYIQSQFGLRYLLLHTNFICQDAIIIFFILYLLDFDGDTYY